MYKNKKLRKTLEEIYYEAYVLKDLMINCIEEGGIPHVIEDFLSDDKHSSRLAVMCLYGNISKLFDSLHL